MNPVAELNNRLRLATVCPYIMGMLTDWYETDATQERIYIDFTTLSSWQRRRHLYQVASLYDINKLNGNPLDMDTVLNIYNDMMSHHLTEFANVTEEEVNEYMKPAGEL